MKKLILPLLAAVCTTLFVACKNDANSVKGVSLSEESLTLRVGEEKHLEAVVLPASALMKEVDWSSSNASVATVSTDGKIVGVGLGTAIITVTTRENNEKATCEVQVVANNAVVVGSIGAIAEVEGTWSRFTDVIVNGHIKVKQGSSLTIEEGVKININTNPVDESGTKIEFLIEGNLYVKGTESAPVLFSVDEAKRNQKTNNRYWGGIICGANCGEVLLDHAIVEYTGSLTTVNSPCVTSGYFKPAGGDGIVAFNTNSTSIKVVIRNSTFRYTSEDAIYMQGGQGILTGNRFYLTGDTGGEAINIKAGTRIDASYNLIYSPGTNAFKNSNKDVSPTRPLSELYAYNNTIVNCGWRRDPSDIKGGSVWVESGAETKLYNNLLVNNMWGVRMSKSPSATSVYDYNYYASGTQQSNVPQHIANGNVTAFDGFKPGISDVAYGTNDLRGASAGDKDPKFTNFPFNTNPYLSTSFDASWDFHLQASSPAATGAKSDIQPYFVSSGLQLAGTTYTSPAPALYFGAFGVK